MVIRGRIEDGVVVLNENPPLPNGTEVTVFVRSEPANGRLAAEQRLRKRREAAARIAAVPDENPGDNFSGVDHDQVLYGAP